MFIYVKTFTATQTGTLITPVVCEKCSTSFVYQLTRTGVGTGAAVYGLAPTAAKARAEKAAKKKLAARLRKEVELVPCPHCGWVNLSSIHTYRKLIYRTLPILSIIFLFLTGVADLVYSTTEHARFHRANSLYLTITLIGIAIALTPFLFQFLLRLRINPNKLVKGLPNIPPGTPPPLSAEISPDGQTHYTPIPSKFANIQSDTKWATFRPGQLVFDPLCCQCLDPATVPFKFPISASKPIGVPFCKPCLRKFRIKWLLLNLALLLPATLLGYFVSTLPERIDSVGRAMTWVFITGLSYLVGFVILDKILYPYRLRTVDKSRGIHKIRFKNPAYTALLIRKFAKSDGLV